MAKHLPVKMEDDNTDQPETQEQSREEIFIRNLSICKSVKEAAILAGYSESYADGPLYLKIKKESFQNKVREFYKGTSVAILPRISLVEQNVVKACLEDVGKVPKLAAMLKQIKQAAGVLAQEAPSAPTINIQELKVLITRAIPDVKE